MKILLTGASSFTGYWFAVALSRLGHHVVAPLRAPLAAYTKPPRAERVERLAAAAEIVAEAPFGGERFLDLVSEGGFDLLCHHAARVGEYRSSDFDIVGALAENTHNLPAVLAVLAKKGLRGLVLTGSVFEQNEGAGESPLIAFSPYGLSKGLTAAVVEHRCREAAVPFGKFVIPNPFGPLEEPRFCAYLLRTWKAREIARVETPAYVRDNIHVDLLARAYARFAADLADGRATGKFGPSGYIESQGAFAERFASAMRPRLDLPCALSLARQTRFSEPAIRVNTHPATLSVPDWDDADAWDRIADASGG